MRNAPLVFHGTLTSPEGRSLPSIFVTETPDRRGRSIAFCFLVETAAADAGCDADLIDFDDDDGTLRFGGVVLGTVAIEIAGSSAR